MAKNVLPDSLSRIDLNRSQPYLNLLYQAMILRAYYGLFRIGEITDSRHVVRFVNVSATGDKKKFLFVL